MKKQKTKQRIQKAVSSFCPLPNKGKAGLRNEKGIALVLVMVLAMIALVFVGAMLFMVTQGTMLSGAYKVYKSAEDASLGGTAIVKDYMAGKGALFLPGLMPADPDYRCVCDANNDGDLTTDDNQEWKISTNTNMKRTCRCDKICNSTVNWPAGCDATLDPTTNGDLKLTLGGGVDALGNPLPSYDVFGKIVDTVEGNSDMGGLVTGGGSLGGGGVVASNAGMVSPAQSPYLYRIEVQAQKTTNPLERSRLSVLYAY